MKKFLGCLLSVTLIQGSIQAGSWVSPKAWSYWYNSSTADARNLAVEEWFKCEATCDAFKDFVKKQQDAGTFVNETYLKSDLLNAYNVGGEETRLHLLVREQGLNVDLELVKCLVDLGVNVNVTNKAGNTPLLLLLQLNDITKEDLGGKVTGLVNLGANPAALTRSGKTALHILAAPSQKGQVFDRDIIQWCVAQGVNASAVDANGNTVLHILALRGSLTQNIDTFEYLVNDLKVPNLVNSKNQTFADILEAKCFTGEDSAEVLARLKALIGVDLNLREKPAPGTGDGSEGTPADPSNPTGGKPDKTGAGSPTDAKPPVVNSRGKNLLIGLGAGAVVATLYYVYTSNQKSQPVKTAAA